MILYLHFLRIEDARTYREKEKAQERKREKRVHKTSAAN